MTHLKTVGTDDRIEKLSENEIDRVQRELAIRLASKSTMLRHLRSEVLGLEREIDALAADGETLAAEMMRRFVP